MVKCMEQSKQEGGISGTDEKSEDFERLQIWLGFIKFILGTVVLGLITTLINYHIQQKEIELKKIEQQRTIELKEQEQLGNFIQHALQEDIGTRKRFAEYFSTVTRSEDLRQCWISYYKLVKYEFDETKNEVHRLKEELKSEVVNAQKKIEIESEVERLELKLEVPKSSKSSRYSLAVEKEREGFEALIESEFEKAIIAFEDAEKIYPSFHQNYEIARLLKKDREKLNDPVEKKNILIKIINDYSWGAPRDMIDRLREIHQ